MQTNIIHTIESTMYCILQQAEEWLKCSDKYDNGIYHLLTAMYPWVFKAWEMD